MNRPPIHPGEILADEMIEAGLSAAELARQLKVPPNRISRIIAGRRTITRDTALRLGDRFGNNAAFWLNLHAPAAGSRRRSPIAAVRDRIARPRKRPLRHASTGGWLLTSYGNATTPRQRDPAPRTCRRGLSLAEWPRPHGSRFRDLPLRPGSG